MNCVDFFSGPIDETIELARSATNPLVVFLHIPKTGGTSIQRDLNHCFPRGVHIPSSSIEHSWRRTIKSLDRLQPDLIRGHLSHLHVAELRNSARSIKAVSYLRDPLDRLLSEFFWRQSKFPHKFIVTNQLEAFATFLDSKRKNPMCKILVGACETADEAIGKIIEQYWFIGLTEHYHACQTLFLAALGKEYRIRRRLNQSNSPNRETEDFKSHFVERAQERMSIDFAIFEYFSKLWSRRINDVIESQMRIHCQRQTVPVANQLV